MKAYILTAAALIAVAGTPTAAQYPGSSGYNSGQWNSGVSINNRIDLLERRLQTGIQAGTITRAEARPVRRELRYLRDLEQQYSYNGFTRAERSELQNRIRQVRQQLRVADNGAYDRYDDRYGWADNNYPRYNEVSYACVARTGMTSILGSILGSDNCLRVGERVNIIGNLPTLPSSYRREFPDSNGVYHRWVDGRVVQIDARTQTVTHIYVVTG